MPTHFFAEGRILSGVITLLVATLVVWLSARWVIDRSSILASILTVLLATFVSGLVAAALPGWLGLVLAAAVWALIAAFFFRTDWIKGAIIGLVAWVLWVVIRLVVEALT